MAIALITDFGNNDFYTGILKGTINKINPNKHIIDISHNVKSFSISNAQYILHSSYKYFPDDTVFLVIVDPGVGSKRKSLIVQDERRFYILPDNGIISAILTDKMEIYEIHNKYFKNASKTFHGRDIFAPVAAYLSVGIDLGKFANRIKSYIKKPFPDYKETSEGFRGRVLHIDKFGNVITSIPNEKFNMLKSKEIIISYNDKKYNALTVDTYSDLDENILGLINGSSDFIEISINMKSAESLLGISVDDEIFLEKK